MTGIEIALIIGAVAMGATVQGCTGIGFSLVAGPILLMIDPAFAPGPLLAAGIIINLRNVVTERDHLDRVEFQRSLFGVPFGVVAAIAVVELVPERPMSILVGLGVCLATAALLSGIRPERSSRTGPAVGFGVALAGVAAGLPGPPLVVGYHDLLANAMRAIAGALIGVVAVVGISSLALTGNFGIDETVLWLWMVPGLIMGLALARVMSPLMDREWFRPLVLTLAFIGGAALVVRQVVR